MCVGGGNIFYFVIDVLYLSINPTKPGDLKECFQLTSITEEGVSIMSLAKDFKYNLLEVALFELLVWPHEVEPWFHSWYRGRVETLDAKYNLGSSL